MVNCLVGLLLLTRELKLIRQEDNFSKWNFDANKIVDNTGTGRYKDREKKSIALQTVIEKMRHCIAHARFYFKAEDGKNRITHVAFRDFDEFEVVISATGLKNFVEKLAASAKSKLKAEGNDFLELGRKDEQYSQTDMPKQIKDIALKLSPDRQQLLLDETHTLLAEENS